MSDAFYLPDGEDRFLATELTRGPWDPRAQHAGPPAALQVAPRRLRDGRNVDLVEASLTAGGVEVMRATALRIRGAELPLPPGLGEPRRLEGPDQGRAVPFFPTGQELGYHTAMEWR